MVVGSVLIPIEYSGSSPSNQMQALKLSDDHISVTADEAAPSVTVAAGVLVPPQAERKETNKMNTV
jgi:hypothetical protein